MIWWWCDCFYSCCYCHSNTMIIFIHLLNINEIEMERMHLAQIIPKWFFPLYVCVCVCVARYRCNRHSANSQCHIPTQILQGSRWGRQTSTVDIIESLFITLNKINTNGHFSNLSVSIDQCNFPFGHEIPSSYLTHKFYSKTR